MTTRRQFFKTLAITAAFVAALGGQALAEGTKVKVAWSVWTGWMPFKLMEKEGLLQKRCKELGVDVELVEFKGYTDSVTAFASQKVDACAMTCMEALQPAASGVKTIAVIANDTSNGGDGVLVRKGMTIKSLKGKKVFLEQFSVSHYLLTRALAENGMVEGDVTVVNMLGDEAGKAFLTDDKVEAVATWNPHLFNAQEGDKGVVAFDSTKIPGEIIDLLVFNAKTVEANPKAVQAVTLAWYDAVSELNNPATRERAIKVMAEGAGSTPKEFEKMLGGTKLYTKPEETIEFFGSDRIQATMKKVKKFCADHELISDPKFEIGFGKGSKAQLVFDSSFAAQVGGKKAGDKSAAPVEGKKK